MCDICVPKLCIRDRLLECERLNLVIRQSYRLRTFVSCTGSELSFCNKFRQIQRLPFGGRFSEGF